MANVTYTQLIEAIRAALAVASGINEAQASTTMTESIQNLPVLQVYLETEETSADSGTDRTTFRAGVRQPEITINVDVYVRQRAHIGEDLAACYVTAQAVRDVLAAQNTQPYFARDGIQSFRWRMERVTFDYSGVLYAGLRFILTMRVY